MTQLEAIEIKSKEIDGKYVKLERFEQLQALTKEFAEGIIAIDTQSHQCGDCGMYEKDNGGKEHKDYCCVPKAQRYLDSLKED